MSVEVPTSEEQPRHPLSDYGIRKAAIESMLLSQSDVPATVLHPGHLVGEGWIPLNPAANFNPRVFRDLAGGRAIALPNLRARNPASRSRGRRSTGFHQSPRTLAASCRAKFSYRVAGRPHHDRLRRSRRVPGMAKQLKSNICPGKNGAAPSRKRKRELLGTTSPDRRIAASPKRKSCWATSRAIARSPRFGNPCSRRITRPDLCAKRPERLARLWSRRGRPVLFAAHPNQPQQRVAIERSVDRSGLNVWGFITVLTKRRQSSLPTITLYPGVNRRPGFSHRWWPQQTPASRSSNAQSTPMKKRKAVRRDRGQRQRPLCSAQYARTPLCLCVAVTPRQMTP